MMNKRQTFDEWSLGGDEGCGVRFNDHASSSYSEEARVSLCPRSEEGDG
jgi:hypothetical protein